MTAKTYTRKVGLNRGKPRVWLEGSILKDNGFSHGTSWVMDAHDGSVWLTASPDGNRRVAGTVDRPIIDINSAKALQGFDADEVVVVEVLSAGLVWVHRQYS